MQHALTAGGGASERERKDRKRRRERREPGLASSGGSERLFSAHEHSC